MSNKNYVNLDEEGNPWTREGHIPDITLVEESDKYFYAGWYFNDECEQMHGPFNTLEEAVKLRRQYIKAL